MRIIFVGRCPKSLHLRHLCECTKKYRDFFQKKDIFAFEIHFTWYKVCKSSFFALKLPRSSDNFYSPALYKHDFVTKVLSSIFEIRVKMVSKESGFVQARLHVSKDKNMLGVESRNHEFDSDFTNWLLTFSNKSFFSVK